jgi:hypothetical protein
MIGTSRKRQAKAVVDVIRQVHDELTVVGRHR